MKQPIFQSVFADDWDKLPPVMHKHYANRPFSNDIITAKGKMTIEFGWFIAIILPFLRLFGALVPYKGENIPVTVQFLSEPTTAAFGLKRTFYLPDKKPHIFFSRIFQIKDNEMIEFMPSGIGWRHEFLFKDNKVILQHKGYALRLFGKIIPFPISLFLGKGHAEEEALSDDQFRMRMTITHPLFGKVYEYRGRFTITDMALCEA